jgi:DNA polymerase-3 subunit epsilon
MSAARGFLAFDVETPQRSNDRICQIGCVEQTPSAIGMNVSEYSYLVDPECGFDAVNISVHHIHPQDVVGAPVFHQVWQSKLSGAFSRHILVAHNAAFDMNVLEKTLRYYRVDHEAFTYVDTYSIARKLYPQLSNHKLDTVSDYLGIDLVHHHDAADDARACYGILMESIRRFGADVVQPVPFPKSVHMENPLGTVDFESFKTLIADVLDDGVVHVDEALKILAAVRSIPDFPPALGQELTAQIGDALVDGRIEAAENSMLVTLLRRVLDPISHIPIASVSGKSFVLTGDFRVGDKDYVSAMIVARGGVVKTGVSRKTDYVVVGSYGSKSYGHGSYGTKVQKAIDLKKSGVNICITGEEELRAVCE